MVPDVAKAGHSFKGAFAYYLHDKRQEDGPQLATAERVAWTETRNLATDDPEAAKRIMIATARQADELKAAAGVKSTGRKSTAHVYAFSLAWHPSEASRLDRTEMMRAVDASLKVLGAEERQAVIVCHTDRSHPHVHVIVNRVDPGTGKMLASSNDFRKLSTWANDYEKGRGKILTPAREERKVRAREAFNAASSPAPMPVAEPQGSPKAPSEAAILKAIGDEQKARHRAAWPELVSRHKAARAATYRAYGTKIKDAVEQHKEEARPIWAQHFRAERDDWRRMEQMEKSLIGRLALSLAAAREQMSRGDVPGRGMLSLTFTNVLSSHLRRATFAAAQERDRSTLADQLKGSLDTRIAAIKTARAEALDHQRQRFSTERAALIGIQNGERTTMREAWRQVYARRGKDPRHMNAEPTANQDQRHRQTTANDGGPMRIRAKDWDTATRSGSTSSIQENAKSKLKSIRRSRQSRPREWDHDRER